MMQTSRSDTKTIIPGIMVVEYNTPTAKDGSPPIEKVTQINKPLNEYK